MSQVATMFMLLNCKSQLFQVYIELPVPSLTYVTVEWKLSHIHLTRPSPPISFKNSSVRTQERGSGYVSYTLIK